MTSNENYHRNLNDWKTQLESNGISVPQSPHTILSRLVGSHFRPPAQLILENLPSGCPLMLDPEPDNPFDPNAIKVCVDWIDIDELIALTDKELVNSGSSIKDLAQMKTIHLGYIAKSGGKPAENLPGNQEVLSLMSACPNHTAQLAFTPEGKPLVKISEK